jgi:DNA-binding response OmpR family regulator
MLELTIMPPPRTLLALLESRDDQRPVLERVAQEAGFRLEIADDLAPALASLGRLTPSALLVESTAKGADQLCQKARFGRLTADLCLLVGAHKVTEAVFAKAVQWGADDAVSLTAEPLTRRLVHLPTEQALPPVGRGTAVVACPDPLRAARIGHVLGYAGYEVDVVTELDAARAKVFSERIALVVVSTQFGRPEDLVGLARESGSRACFVFLVRPSEFTRELNATRTLDRVAVIRDDEPPEAVLFVHNELLGPEADHGRRESRLLYGTLVVFRPAGEAEDDFGFTYNVSPNGLTCARWHRQPRTTFG